MILICKVKNGYQIHVAAPHTLAEASSLSWQTLTASVGVFAHLENVCVKTEGEKLAHLQWVVGNEVGRTYVCQIHRELGDGGEESRFVFFLMKPGEIHLGTSLIAAFQRHSHSASALKLTWAEKPNDEFSQRAWKPGLPAH